MNRVKPETLYFGDCLDVMERWDSQQIDLIYLDPPFKSDVNYNILFGKDTNGKSSQFLAFEDTWEWNEQAVERVSNLKSAVAHPARDVIHGLETILGPSGMLSYLSYMAERLYQCHRVLKDTGSIYLHCDPTASHYLKSLLDAVFGNKNFRNEIVWCYSRPSAPGQRQLSRVHQIVFWYSKSKKWVFNPDEIRQPYSDSSRNREGYDSTASKIAEGKVELDPRGKFPESWIYIPPLKGNSKEYVGYPTQKPLALLHRIIKAGTNEDDLILDPFCGCGTAIVAAHQLNRQWIGIDISAFAIQRVMRMRFQDQGFDCAVQGIPVDLSSSIELARSNPFAFEAWAVNQVPGLAPNIKQVSDGGIDGRGTLLNDVKGTTGKSVLAQVKSGKVSTDNVRAFITVCESVDAAAGLFIHMRKGDVSKPMRSLFAGKGSYELEGSSMKYPQFQFWSLEDFFDGNSYPKLPPMCDPITGKSMQQKGVFEAA